MPDDEAAVQDRITAFWDTVAPNYDSSDNVAPPGTAEYADWVEALRSTLPDPPTRLLDVGTGTGFVARIAAELGHQVTAIDLSERMLEVSATQGTMLSFAVGDAVTPPFLPKSFDAVASRSVLWTLREPERAFCSWYDLVRPGGRVVAIYGMSPDPHQSPTTETDEPDEDAGFFERHYTPHTRAALTAMHLTDHEPVTHAAEAAGFRDVTVTPLEIVRGWETSPGSDLPYALVGYRPDGR